MMANPGELQANAVLPSSVAPSNAAENMKLIKLVLHAHNCQRRESQTNRGQSQCTLPHCENMKDVLHHMTTCQAGRNCTVTGCISSRQIISHWEQCSNLACPVCSHVVFVGQNRGNVSANQPNQPVPVGNADSQDNITNTTANVDNVEFERALYVLGVTRPPSPLQNNPPLRLLATLQPSQHSQPLGPPSTLSPRVRSVSSQPQTVTNDVNSPFFPGVQNPNPVLGFGGSAIRPPTSTSGITTASPMQSTKEWHQSMTSDLRNHIFHKLMKPIFPSFDPGAVLDHRMCNVVRYAKKLENDMHEVANWRSEYNHLVAKAIYEMQKE